MNIKVGDKVRIRTEGEIFEVVKEYRDGTYMCLSSSSYCMATASMIVEVIPRTLDEYICGLTLEERAMWFIYNKYNETGKYATYRSSVVLGEWNSYEEALQATIEALKQPKENNNVT